LAISEWSMAAIFLFIGRVFPCSIIDRRPRFDVSP
jgi:hypothetical protein